VLFLAAREFLPKDTGAVIWLLGNMSRSFQKAGIEPGKPQGYNHTIAIRVLVTAVYREKRVYVDRRQRTKNLFRFWLKVLAAGLLYLLLITFTGLRIPCWFYKVTGYQCPGCGVTRMAQELVHLHFREAFAFNPYLMCLLPFLLLYAVYRSRKYIDGSGDQYRPEEKALAWLVLAGAVVFGIARNL
jgi:hypothetical protein